MARTQPFSVRLRETADALVSDEARRLGRTRSAVIEELAEEAAKGRLFPGIAFRGRPRRAWVIGTGLDVWELVELDRSHDGDLAGLHEAHPLIGERHVRIARAYADRFPDEIETLAAAARTPLDELRTLNPFLELGE